MRLMILAAAVLAIAPVKLAQASSVDVVGTFLINEDPEVSTALSDPGLVIQTQVFNDGIVELSLEDGTSTVKLFDIWTNEASLNPDDLETSGTLNVALDLSKPELATGDTTGTVTGDALIFYNLALLQHGELSWADPIEIETSTGLISVLLSDASFNWGLFGLTPGLKYGASVYGTFSYSNIASAPLPGAFVLLLTGMAAMVLAGLRRLRPQKLAEAT